MLYIISMKKFIKSARPCSCAVRAVASAYCVQTGDAPLISLVLLHCVVPRKHRKETTGCGSYYWRIIQVETKNIQKHPRFFKQTLTAYSGVFGYFKSNYYDLFFFFDISLELD